MLKIKNSSGQWVDFTPAQKTQFINDIGAVQTVNNQASDASGNVTITFPILDNLTAGGTGSALSAEQSKVLKGLIDANTNNITDNTNAISGKADTVKVVVINANVTITPANQSTYNGNLLEFSGAFTVTISGGLANDFGFAAIPPATGNATIASDGTASLNGATTSITRAASTTPMFGVQQRASNRNSYVVS